MRFVVLGLCIRAFAVSGGSARAGNLLISADEAALPPASDATKIPALCKTVIDFAHSFGRHVVAVGIEKAAGAVALVSMGCDDGQAYLLGQPMPQERFVSLLRQRRGNAGAQPEGRRC